MTKKTSELAGRYTLFVIGLFIASLGVAFSTKAGLGTSPVSSVPYTISLISSIFSFGGWLNLFSTIQILIQVLLQKGRCNYPEIFIQTVLAFVYGYLTNFSCWLIRDLNAGSYPVQLFYMAAGCFILALGIWIQLKGGVAMLPGEAMNREISRVTGKRYENVKIFFDILYISIAALLGFIFLGRLAGVREGSIIAAFAVGTIIRGYEHLFQKIKV